MLRIAICEDQKAMLDLIRRFAENEFKTRNVKNEVSSYLNGYIFLKHHEINPFDIVFLDIAMPEINGFEVAKQIRKKSNKVIIVFISTESSLVYDSFDYQPCFFIPKSTTEFLKSRLTHVVNKMNFHLSMNEILSIELPHNEKKSISVRDLIYVKSDGNYLEYHIINAETVRIRQKLDVALENLNIHIFSRIHNRFCVNMRFIETVASSNSFIILSTKQELNISRAYRNSFAETYAVFMQNYN